MRKWRDHIRAKKELILEEIHLGTSLKGGISKGSARIEIFFVGGISGLFSAIYQLDCPSEFRYSKGGLQIRCLL